MALMTTRKPSPPALERPGTATPYTAEEIEQTFQRFRESAVRFVEQINDMVGLPADPEAQAHRELQLVRTIFGKWSTDILLMLHSVTAIGFEELRRSLSGISPRVLSLKLRELEQSGMVHREIIDSRPPRVRYALTTRGWTVTWLCQPIFMYIRLTDDTPVRPTRGVEEPNEMPAEPD